MENKPTMTAIEWNALSEAKRAVWYCLGLGEGFVAAVLLFSGGLKALQTASIAAAMPARVIMALMAHGIIRSLN